MLRAVGALEVGILAYITERDNEEIRAEMAEELLSGNTKKSRILRLLHSIHLRFVDLRTRCTYAIEKTRLQMFTKKRIAKTPGIPFVRKQVAIRVVYVHSAVTFCAVACSGPLGPPMRLNMRLVGLCIANASHLFQTTPTLRQDLFEQEGKEKLKSVLLDETDVLRAYIYGTDGRGYVVCNVFAHRNNTSVAAIMANSGFCAPLLEEENIVPITDTLMH